MSAVNGFETLRSRPWVEKRGLNSPRLGVGKTRRRLAWEQTSGFLSTGSKMVHAWSNPESLPLLAMSAAATTLQMLSKRLAPRRCSENALHHGTRSITVPLLLGTQDLNYLKSDLLHISFRRVCQSVKIGVEIGDHVLEGDLGAVCFS
jgi:hypothetical protein